MMTTKSKLVKKFYLDKTVKRISKKVNLLGSNCKYNPISILNTRTITSVLLFTVVIIIFDYGYIFAPILAICYWLLDEYVSLDLKIKKRSIELDKEGVFFFEVLALSIGSGKNIKEALELTVANVSGDLSNEFKKCLEEMKIGKGFSEAFMDVRKRIPNDDINNIIISLDQASIYGNNVVDTLNTQIEYLRNKRILTVRKEINKLPIKISIISVLFYIPIIILLILSPILISLLG